MSLTKTQKIGTLVKQVNKYVKNNTVPAPPQERNVLDVLMYAALFENTVFEYADLALAKLQNYFIDWNEVRVCTIKELAGAIPMIPRADEAARRIKRSLQALFEKTYAYDLEHLKKRGKSAAEALKQLEEINAGTPFMIDYTAQVALGTHIIPLDEAAFRILRPLGLTQLSKDEMKELGAGLERAVPKSSAMPFSVKFHHLAALFYANPEMPERTALLKAVDPESLQRSSDPPQLKKPEPPPKQFEKPKPVSVPIPADLDDEDDIIRDDLVYGDDEPKTPEKAKRGRKPGTKMKPKAMPSAPVAKPKKKEPPAKPPEKKPVPKPAPKPTAKPPVKKAAVKPSKVSPPKKTVKTQKPEKKPVKAAKSKSPSKDLRKRKPK
ncbi:MAG: hypothetical protein LBT89_08040 [Planctomycetaceae bacterium]|jgi:endonuclease-3|nr:hypothetical protein [Planctomycetaceae bacterium]